MTAKSIATPVLDYAWSLVPGDRSGALCTCVIPNRRRRLNARMCMNSEKNEFDRYAPSICICMNRASDGFTSADVIPPVQLRDTSTAS